MLTMVVYRFWVRAARGASRNDAGVTPGSAIEYFTWLSAKLNSIEAMQVDQSELVF